MEGVEGAKADHEAAPKLAAYPEAFPDIPPSWFNRNYPIPIAVLARYPRASGLRLSDRFPYGSPYWATETGIPRRSL